MNLLDWYRRRWEYNELSRVYGVKIFPMSSCCQNAYREGYVNGKNTVHLKELKRYTAIPQIMARYRAFRYRWGRRNEK